MNHNLTCEQILSLLNFYIENTLSPELSRCVEYHLCNCPSCQSKFKELKSVLSEFQDTENLSDKILVCENTINPDIKKKLSEYIDNELCQKDNIKIRKIAIANPAVKRALNNMYNYKILLKQSYNKTKNELKKDYSKSVLDLIYDKDIYSTNFFYKLVIIFAIMIITIMIGFLYLYF